MSERQDEARIGTSDNSIKHEKRSRPWLIYAVVLLLVFLAGLIPAGVVAYRRGVERDTAQAALRVSNLQIALGNALVDTRTGNFERARQGTSEFFTNLGTEVERGRGSIFNESQEAKLRTLFEERDNTITALARSDPYSTDRLTKLYNQYREAVAITPAP